MGPMVTIGVCVRNCETSVKEAMDSILTQDFPHNRIKVVFVDDGSQDGTLSVVQNYVGKMDMATVVFHTSWRGLGKARNLVIANAEGDYILWVDGDMELSRDFLRKLVEFMEENARAGIVKGIQDLSPGLNLLATLEGYSRAYTRMVDYGSEKGRYKTVGTGGALYRIRALKQVGGFDDGMRGYCEDWDVELRLMRAGWSRHTVDVAFFDELHRLTWKSLWRRYWLRGYFTHHFVHKYRGIVKHYRNFPPAASLYGLLGSVTLFRLTRHKAVFLLPFEFVFKMTAWYVGFLRSHFDSYAPKS